MPLTTSAVEASVAVARVLQRSSKEIWRDSFLEPEERGLGEVWVI